MIARKDFVRIVLSLCIHQHLRLVAPVPSGIVFQGETTFREIRCIGNLIETLLIIRHHVVILDVSKSCPEIIAD